MSFAHPAALWLLAPLLPLLLMLHARRRRDLVVPSLAVWRRVASDMAAAPSHRRFPWRDVNLWLQVLALVLLVLALARPAFGAGDADRDWVVLVDTSTSMNATDGQGSRMAAVAAVMEERWGRQGSTGKVSVVEVSQASEVIAASWSAGPGFVRAIERLEPGGGAADWVGAAVRAELLAREGGAKVVVLTDAYGVESAESALSAVGFTEGEIEFLLVGGELINVGISGVKAETRGQRPDQWSVSGLMTTSGLEAGDVVRVVASFRSAGTETFLPWGGADVVIGADGTGEFVVPLDLPGQGEVELRGPPGDQLAVDDVAYLVLRPDPVRVAVVGPEHPAVLRALAAIGGLEVYSTDSVPAPGEANLFDLVIITGDVAGVPATSTLWLGSVPDGAAAGDTVEMTNRTLDVGAHTLVSDVDPAALSVTRARPLLSLEGATTLMHSGDTVLAWARTTMTGRQVVVGFGPDDSDWPSQVSFPAFIAAVVDWSSMRGWSYGPRSCVVGDRCGWPREAFAGGWELNDPSGGPVAVQITPRDVAGDPLATGVWDQELFDAGFVPKRAGLYELTSPRGTIPLAVQHVPLGEPAGTTAGAITADAVVNTQLWPWLVAAALAVLVGELLLEVRGKNGVVRRRWRVPVTFAAAAAVLLGLALLGAPVPASEPGGSVAWVGKSGSDAAYTAARGSIAGRAWSRVEWRPLSAAGDAAGDAAGPDVVGPGLTARDAAMAVELALAAEPTGDARAVVVYLGPDRAPLPADSVAALSRRAATTGTEIHVVGSLPAAVEGEAAGAATALRRVALPERVKAGASFVLNADVVAPEGDGWTLRAELVEWSPRAGDEVPAPPMDDMEVVLEASTSGEANGIGRAQAEIELTAGSPGDLTYSLKLVPAGSSTPIAESLVTVQVGGHLEVLLVATDDVQGGSLLAGLAAQGVVVTRTTPFRMPNTVEELAEFDAVALVNVPASAMFAEYHENLERYVRELGGGLAIFGGTGAYGPGGYYTTALEDLSPLSARISEEAPEVALAFVLDRSGSMSGAVGGSTRMDVAKAATVEALTLLGEKSSAALVAFDTEARIVLPFTSVEEVEEFRSALATVDPAGGTSIYPGLLAALEVMGRSESATRHVVVMTDGLSQEGDFEGVIRALDDLGVSISFVGVGEAADRRQLNTLAGLSGGALHMASDFRALPGLLAQEALMLGATPIEERQVQGRWTGSEPPAFLADVVAKAPPELHGYVRTTAKDEATVHLVEGVEDDPLLASWRYGLGRVVAFASAADGPWAAEWESMDSYGRLWSQALRWVGERPVREEWAVRVSAEGDVVDVVVDVPATARHLLLPIVELRSDGRVLGLGDLTELSEGLAGARFEIETGWEGRLDVTLVPVAGGALEAPTTRSVFWPLLPGSTMRSDLVPLTTLAAVTGGTVGPSGELPAVSPRLAWRRAPGVWLVLALAAFLTSLGLRYGGFAHVTRALTAGRRERRRTTLLAR